MYVEKYIDIVENGRCISLVNIGHIYVVQETKAKLCHVIDVGY